VSKVEVLKMSAKDATESAKFLWRTHILFLRSHIVNGF